jgi:IS5 family transposase
METLPERLDWLLFLGYDLDDEIPHHSVLSKARKRWGVRVFQGLFERAVWECVEAGLVDGDKLFSDASLVEANASNNSVVDRTWLQEHLSKSYAILEQRLEEQEEEESSDGEAGMGAINQRHVSTTDADATVVRQGKGKSKLRYKTHRAVDSAYGVVTATEITTGAVHEAHRLKSLLQSHRYNTGRSAEIVVADNKYGTVENFLWCSDRGIKAHIPDLKEMQDKKGLRGDVFPEEAFAYDASTDTYRCPGGETLKRRRHKKKRKAVEYATSGKVCASCKIRPRCTTSAAGRSVKRHLRQQDLDLMRSQARGAEAKRDIRIRQHFMERSFGEATRYGYKRARWRGLWRVAIQDYLVATVQNLRILLTHAYKPKRAIGGRGYLFTITSKGSGLPSRRHKQFFLFSYT